MTEPIQSRNPWSLLWRGVAIAFAAFALSALLLVELSARWVGVCLRTGWTGAVSRWPQGNILVPLLNSLPYLGATVCVSVCLALASKTRAYIYATLFSLSVFLFSTLALPSQWLVALTDFALQVSVGLIVVWAVKRMQSHNYPIGHCRLCGYDLTGNTRGTCTECGTRFERPPDNPAGNEALTQSSV